MIKKALILFNVVWLFGCATTWKKVDVTDKYIDKKLSFSASLPLNWMYFPGTYFSATKDGVLLDNILVERVKFNVPLVATKKQFKPDMLLVELAEVDIDDYRSNGENLNFELVDNKVVALDGKDAYCFKCFYQNTAGLKKKVIVYGLVYNDFVYRICYSAAEQHYYDLYEKDFEDFVKSLKFL